MTSSCRAWNSLTRAAPAGMFRYSETGESSTTCSPAPGEEGGGAGSSASAQAEGGRQVAQHQHRLMGGAGSSESAQTECSDVTKSDLSL